MQLTIDHPIIESGKRLDMEIKNVLWFTMATFAAIFLIVWTVDSFGFRSPVSALLVNWLAMSWVAIVGQAIHFSFASGYYEIQSFEQTGQVYEHLGVHLFKTIVRRGPLSIFSSTLRFPKEKTISALCNLDSEMRKAETGHLLIFILMLLFSGYALLEGWLDAVAWLLMFNILINGYPIMLQRYNRIKLQELIRKQAV